MIIVCVSAQFVVIEVLAWYVAQYLGFSFSSLVITAAILTVAQVISSHVSDHTCWATVHDHYVTGIFQGLG